MNNKVKKKFATNDKLSNHGLQGQGCPSPDVLLNVVRILQYNNRYLNNPYPGSQISKFKYDLLKQKKSYQTAESADGCILGASQQMSGNSYFVRQSGI